MEENTGICFITGESCVVTDILCNGQQYLVKESLADDHPLRKLKEMIAEKIAAEEDKKQKALEALNTAVDALGIDKEAFQALLLGQQAKSNSTPKSKSKTVHHKKEDDSFKEVDGQLKGDFAINAKLEEGVSSSLPGYSTVHDNEGRTIKEEDKKVKMVDSKTRVSVGSLGRTVIRIDHRSGHEIDKMIRQVDSETNELIRPAVSGQGHISGHKTVECPLCKGSGITRIGDQKCPKCEGSGFLTA